MNAAMTLQRQARYELRFRSLFNQGRGYALIGAALSLPEVRPRTQKGLEEALA